MNNSNEDAIKTQMIERFSHFIDWPKNSLLNGSNSFITIGIIGKDAIIKNIENTFLKIKIKNKPVKIVVFSSVNEISNCDILYISKSAANKLNSILQKIENYPILSISDIENSASEGVIISFLVDSSVSFEINETKAKSLQFEISYKLLSFAKNVY